MSKPDSGLFSGTIGSIAKLSTKSSDVIAARSRGLNLQPHPRNEPSYSAKQRKDIQRKIDNRTATKDEYKHLMSDKRFSARRQKGVREFWKQERKRLKTGQNPTRNWSDEQRQDILSGLRPKYGGRTLQAHHTYSAKQFPHLADLGQLIFPVTADEHLYGWHGGNYRNSSPGTAIRYKTKYSFRR